MTPKSWPFEEAKRVADRLAATGKTKALFETGYGPSGLPHIGTFMEVARTSWVRHAFGVLTGLDSDLLAFSDDMDGLRKVPGNVPQQDMLAKFIGMPLTSVPEIKPDANADKPDKPSGGGEVVRLDRFRKK